MSADGSAEVTTYLPFGRSLREIGNDQANYTCYNHELFV